MDEKQLIVSLFMMSAVIFVGFLISFVILIWFRTAVFNEIKLRKLIKKGYIIARLKRFDKTEKEIVTIPDREKNGVTFPGVDGTYTLDNASVILKNRKYAVYEWREGDTSPINHEKEFVSTKLGCPECKHEFTASLERPRSISPSVLDNLILKIKTLAQLNSLNKWLLIILIFVGVGIVGHLIIGQMLYDLKTKGATAIAQQAANACRNAMINQTIVV